MKMTKHVFYICIVIAALLFFVPRFVQDSYYLMIFNQALINIMVVLGLNFVTGLTGQMNFGMAGIFAAGAYTSALFSTEFNISPWITLVFSAIVGLLLGLIIGWPSLRIKGKYLALTTLASGEIIRLLANNMKSITGGTDGITGIPQYNLFGFIIGEPKGFYYLLLVLAIIATVIAVVIVKSKWGRVFKAIRDNDQAVETCGISVAEIKIKAFILSTIYASVAGALYAHLMGFIDPSAFGLDLSIKYLMMLMFGGIGSVPGSVLGASIITLLPEYLRFLKDYYWLVFSIIVLIMFIFLPNGIVSLLKKPFQSRKNSRSGVK